MALVGALALAADVPLLFPALGASAVIVFAAPEAPGSRPRHVVCSHALGALVGHALLVAAGTADAAHALVAPLDASHLVTGVLALLATTWLMRVLGVHHPAAGATTMIVGLGLLPRATDLAWIVLAAALLCAYARLVLPRAGYRYPTWA